MNESSIDEEHEALNRRSRGITVQLPALTAQDGNLDDEVLEMHHNALLGRIREIERRLVDIDLDERNLRRMEGGE